MCATSSKPGGFTLVELLTVLMLAAVLATTVLPRLDGALAWRSTGWRAQVQAALRHAGATAHGHRRLVCASVATGAVTLSIASSHPASGCNTALPGHDGHADHARDGAAPATAVLPAGTLYFQPDGRVTSDGAGTTPADRRVTIAGEADINITGANGHVW